ncbi:hypothetical protein D3C78_966280 [compost metagenome]
MAFGPVFIAGKHHEARDVVFRILDIFSEDIETVEAGGKTWRKGRHAAVALFGHEPCGACRIAGDDGLPAVGTDDLAALAKRVDVAVDGANLILLHAGHHHQLEADRHEVFADDVQARFRQQVMNIRNAAGQCIFNRDHTEISFAVFNGVEGILEGRAGQRLHIREHVAAGHVGIRAEFALEGNTICAQGHGTVR